MTNDKPFGPAHCPAARQSRVGWRFQTQNSFQKYESARTKTFAPIGHKRRAVAEGNIPETSHGQGPEMTSHQTIGVLNVSDNEAPLQIWIFCSDRNPVGPYKVSVLARRTGHIRFNDLTGPERIPRDTDFGIMVESGMRLSYSIRGSICGNLKMRSSAPLPSQTLNRSCDGVESFKYAN